MVRGQKKKASIHFVPWHNRYETLGWQVTTNIASYVFCSEIRNRPIILDATSVADGLGSQIVVLAYLPG